MPLTCTLIASALTQPIADGTVAAPELGLQFAFGNVDDNSRGMIAGKFDVAEMSTATFIQALSHGADLVALPIFLGRRFLQPCVLFAANAGIAAPADLRGKRIAFPQFWMTSSVWHRGIMESEYGVPATAVEFLTTQDERLDAPFTPGVKVTQIANRPLMEFFGMIPELISAGTADVIFAPRAPQQAGDLRGLFADPVEASLAYERRTGVYPMMHAIVVRGALVRERAELAPALGALFRRAKEQAYANAGRAEVESPVAGLAFEAARARLGGDPYPFGLVPNAKAIEAFLDFAADQHLSRGRVALERAFVDA